MLAVGFKTACQTATFDRVNDRLDLLVRENWRGSAFDIAKKTITASVIHRHRRLEGGIADKGNHREDLFIAKPEQRLQGAGMFLILMQRILEAMVATIDLLGPVLLLLAAEDPALHILGLDREYTIDGDDHMVDLGGSILGR